MLVPVGFTPQRPHVTAFMLHLANFHRRLQVNFFLTQNSPLFGSTGATNNAHTRQLVLRTQLDSAEVLLAPPTWHVHASEAPPPVWRRVKGAQDFRICQSDPINTTRTHGACASVWVSVACVLCACRIHSQDMLHSCNSFMFASVVGRSFRSPTMLLTPDIASRQFMES